MKEKIVELLPRKCTVEAVCGDKFCDACWSNNNGYLASKIQSLTLTEIKAVETIKAPVVDTINGWWTERERAAYLQGARLQRQAIIQGIGGEHAQQR